MDRALAMILAPERLDWTGAWIGLEEAGVADPLMVPLTFVWMGGSSL